MSRLMSVAFTEQAVRDRTKTVSRRKGWWLDKNDRPLIRVGDHLTLVRKAMGLKKGEKIVRVANVEIVHLSREPLCALTMDLTYGQTEMCLEGFPGLAPEDFIEQYFLPQRMDVLDEVTRIEWRYLDA